VEPALLPDIINEKKSTKWKKLENTERKDRELNTWFIEKDTRMNTINR